VCEEETPIDIHIEYLKRKFGVGSYGTAEYFLQIQIIREKDYIWIGQPQYAERILEKFEFKSFNYSPLHIPMSPSWKHDENSPELSIMEKSAYRSLLMSLAHLANNTRPDLACAVNILAQYQNNARLCDMKALLRILRYLSGTKDLGLLYQRGNIKSERQRDGTYLIRRINDMPVCYSDASYAEEIKRHSRTGVVVLFAGAAISWISKKQSVIALSSTEAELNALTEGSKIQLWIEQFYKGCGLIGPEYFVIKQDNQSAIDIAENPIHYNRVKHMDVKNRFVNELIRRRKLKVEKCHTSEMIADILTKPLPRKIFTSHVKSMGLYSKSDLQKL
jgi:hypothetical protein